MPLDLASTEGLGADGGRPKTKSLLSLPKPAFPEGKDRETARPLSCATEAKTSRTRRPGTETTRRNGATGLTLGPTALLLTNETVTSRT